MASGSPRGVLLAALAAGGLLLVSVLIDKDTNGEQTSVATSAPPSSQAPRTTEEPVGPAARSAIGEAAPAPLSGTLSAAGTNFADPRSVAKAYIEAAHSAEADEIGRTNRRVLPYLAPENPDNPRGSLVVEATGKAVVISVEVAVGNEEQSAATTKVTWRSGDGQLRETFVTLRRQPDGRWLVMAEMARLQPADR
ncbi:hypothetical protein SK854_13930 [Lentzea sp. BCCO 10_0061]|uniref:Mce-associated membrane protein n=1 Tax=Lentzea sokolovensis TaxID=3095429 RepID=A0ABU4UVN5_9PSEU|nr:hypothetical protein [Lentzea sp. BCCO 10_0061]MDX8143222.1 hypothetical protein [Lentzea sp. BCCO 10_0061]